MTIAVIGVGAVGAALGRRWAEIGHDVTFGVRDKTAGKVTRLLNEITTTANATDIDAAVKNSETVVLAVPFNAIDSVLQQCGDLTGKIVIDCTNPLAGMDALTVGTTDSAGESIARKIPTAKVVKAFNVTGSNNMENPKYNGSVATMFICGDNLDAKKKVTALSNELGFETIDTGDITMARYLEPLAMLWIKLAYQQKLGREIAITLLKR